MLRIVIAIASGLRPSKFCTSCSSLRVRYLDIPFNTEENGSWLAGVYTCCGPKKLRAGQGPAVHFAGVTVVSVTGTQVRAVDVSVARRAAAARITVAMSEAGSVRSHKRGAGWRGLVQAAWERVLRRVGWWPVGSGAPRVGSFRT